MEESLGALSKSRDAPDRVVVVDSASRGPEVREVASAAGASVVRCDLPGLGRARNAGVAVVEEDLVAFTDDDCLVDESWIGALRRAFADPSAPDFVTGEVRTDTEVHRRAWLGVSLTTATSRRRLEPGDDPRQFGHGANMAWRAPVLRGIGGFDDHMGVGSPLRAAEDVDAWWRGLRAGCHGIYEPEAVVVHRQWRSRRAALRAYHGYGIGAGALAVKRYRLERHSQSANTTAKLLRSLVVEEGARPLLQSLRQGYQMGAVANVVMFVGALRGAARARQFVLFDGKFATADGARRR